jgi:DNA repair exonuclease SbcCD ATPase subunit
VPLDELSAMRRKQLQENIQESYALLKEYEDALLVADDPKEKIRCRREIERLQDGIARYREELLTLEKDEPPTPASRPQPSARIINTGGGTYVEGSVYTGGGAFVGRDQIASGVGRGTPAASPDTEQERIASLLRQREKVRRNINRLEEMRASYGANVPLEILNQLDDAHEELERIERELEGLGGLR